MSATYNHDYATCVDTYATLCIYHDDLNPDAITKALGLEPSSSHRRGDVRNPKRPIPHRTGAWLLSTEGAVTSRDVRFHIDWLLERLQSKQTALSRLKTDGYQLVISCYWLSARGHGGPMIDPEAMRSIGELGLQLSFDVYFHGDYIVS